MTIDYASELRGMAGDFAYRVSDGAPTTLEGAADEIKRLRAERDSLRRFALLVEESSLDDPEHIVDACDAALGGQFDDWASHYAPDYAPGEGE